MEGPVTRTHEFIKLIHLCLEAGNSEATMLAKLEALSIKNGKWLNQTPEVRRGMYVRMIDICKRHPQRNLTMAMYKVIIDDNPPMKPTEFEIEAKSMADAAYKIGKKIGAEYEDADDIPLMDVIRLS